MDDLSSRFLDAWNEIEKTVKGMYPDSRNDNPSDKFAINVRGAAKINAIVRRFQDDLIGYADLPPLTGSSRVV
jgi:hypothetical protein